ncbi:MAG: PKD domain-containing protein [Euryarchaeota archaeon]|nr:PKD domain-containing protein [Euryarchaeota archaeon]
MKTYSGLLATLFSLLMFSSALSGCIFSDDSPEPGSDLEAIFNWSPTTSIQAGTDVTFNGSASLPQDGSLTYRWDFNGDGSNDASDPEVTTSYASEGTYQVILTITDGLGEASSTKEIIILAKTAVLPSADAGSENPDSDCQGNEASSGNFYLIYICEPEKSSSDRNTRITTTVNLDGSASDPGSTNHYMTDWVWDLNTNIDSDGNGIEDDDVDETGEVHEWKDVAIGEYEVQLTVTNNEGHSAQQQVMVHVQYKGDWEDLHINGNQTDNGELVFETTLHYDRDTNNKIKKVDILLIYPTKDDDWVVGSGDNVLNIYMFNETGEEVLNTTAKERGQGCNAGEDYQCITLQVTSYVIDTYEDGDWEIKIINGKATDADDVSLSIEIQYK